MTEAVSKVPMAVTQITLIKQIRVRRMIHFGKARKKIRDCFAIIIVISGFVINFAGAISSVTTVGVFFGPTAR
ncbi:MAG: hypothetical protein M3R67_12860 [Acidobacteriota bacterium]|nr:hypothetical protein [Acidobacteriota bacterium]